MLHFYSMGDLQPFPSLNFLGQPIDFLTPMVMNELVILEFL